jgi:hypothetical protein
MKFNSRTVRISTNKSKEILMKKLFLVTIILCLGTSAFAQEKPTWGCKIRPSTDVVSDVVTLDCRDKGSETKFILDVPRDKWFPEWGLIGDKEFYYGIKDKDGNRFAVKTPFTFCDAGYGPRFGSNQVSFQLCGKMFEDEK